MNSRNTKMEKILNILVCLLFVTISLSVNGGNRNVKGEGQIGLTYSSFGSNDMMSSQKTVGGAGYAGNGFNTFGLTYLHQLNRILDFETGIEYSEHKISILPNLPLIYTGTISNCKVSLINIPAAIRVNFLKYFFVNGGVFLDIDAGNSGFIERQRGLGANLGLGLNYNFKGGISLFVNPYTKVHSLFLSNKIVQRLTESGFRFGLVIQIRN